MFTGLIADLGSVEAVERDDAGATLHIRTRLAGALAQGDSIAVNGVCLTAVEAAGGAFRAEAMPETLARSSLGALGAATRSTSSSRCGSATGSAGHIVQGHVDGTGTSPRARRRASRGWSRSTSSRSSRATSSRRARWPFDGVSLTVSALREDGFAVSLIPETLERTTLGEHSMKVRG